MNPNTRTGLLAVLIVLGLVLVAAVAGGASWLLSGSRVTVQGNRGPIEPSISRSGSEAPAEADLATAVARHRFWQVKVSAADVERLAAEVQKCSRWDVVYVNDRARLGVVSDVRPIPLPEGRRFHFDFQHLVKRPDRQQILEAIRAGLDRALFEQPG